MSCQCYSTCNCTSCLDVDYCTHLQLELKVEFRQRTIPLWKLQTLLVITTATFQESQKPTKIQTLVHFDLSQQLKFPMLVPKVKHSCSLHGQGHSLLNNAFSCRQWLYYYCCNHTTQQHTKSSPPTTAHSLSLLLTRDLSSCLVNQQQSQYYGIPDAHAT